MSARLFSEPRSKSVRPERRRGAPKSKGCATFRLRSLRERNLSSCRRAQREPLVNAGVTLVRRQPLPIAQAASARSCYWLYDGVCGRHPHPLRAAYLRGRHEQTLQARIPRRSSVDRCGGGIRTHGPRVRQVQGDLDRAARSVSGRGLVRRSEAGQRVAVDATAGRGCKRGRASDLRGGGGCEVRAHRDDSQGEADRGVRLHLSRAGRRIEAGARILVSLHR